MDLVRNFWWKAVEVSLGWIFRKWRSSSYISGSVSEVLILFTLPNFWFLILLEVLLIFLFLSNFELTSITTEFSCYWGSCYRTSIGDWLMFEHEPISRFLNMCVLLLFKLRAQCLFFVCSLGLGFLFLLFVHMLSDLNLYVQISVLIMLNRIVTIAKFLVLVQILS